MNPERALGKGLLALLLIGLLLPVGAVGKKYTLYKVGRVPVIDGKLDDRVWQLLPEGRGFCILDSSRSYATSHLTRFQMGYKGDKLYMAFECQEPNLKGIKAVDSYRDGWSFDDSVEIFFAKKGSKEYTHLMINAKGAKWAKKSTAKHDMEIPRDWKAVSGRTATGWTIETEMPLSVIGVTSPDDLIFNVGRNIPSQEKFLRCQSWAKVLTGFAHLPSFATLEKKSYNGPVDVEMESGEINQAYDRKIFLSLLEIRRGGKAWQKIVANYGLSENFASVKKIREDISKNMGRLSNAEKAAIYSRFLDAVKSVSIPLRKISFTAKGTNVSNIQFFVDGKIVNAKNGKQEIVLKEGLTVVGCKVKAGKNAKIAFDFPGGKNLNTRWSYSRKADSKWQNANFDDRKWKSLKDGILPEGEVYLRQVILWNKSHTGNFRCINPTSQVWKVSLDSTEVVYFSLYSPAGLEVNTFDFLLELPKGFRLLDMAPGVKRNRLSLAPESVKEKKLANGGTLYTLRYRKADVHPWKTADSLLGIYKDGSGKVGDKYTIKYARLINGNMTEIDGNIPFEVLPRINGRTFKNMIMSYYMGGMPQGLSGELLDKVVKESVQAGVDTFSVGPYQDPKVVNSKNNRILANGGKLMLGFLNHPVWGSKFLECAVTDLVKNNPELSATYFDGRILTVEEQAKLPSHKLEIRPCPSLVLKKYKKAYFEAVRSDYRKLFFDKWPSAKYVFINWEQEPWLGSVYVKSPTPAKGAYCFCKHCKAGFYKYAKLPAGKTLTNQEIFENYYEKWRHYKYGLDAALHSIVNDAIKSLGRKVFFYSWSNHFGYWDAAKNIDYHLFLGCPGNGTADGRGQLGMDEYMKYHQGKTGRKNITGQRFVFFPQTYGWRTDKQEGWLKFNVMSNDGFIHPESWKTQSIRLFAALQGGYDLQNPLELVSGIKYYVGEATRMAAKYEKIFWNGRRNDKLAASKEIAYPDLLVMEYGKERLVMLFNEGDTPKRVTIKNLKLAGQKKAFAYYGNKFLGDPASFTITIPAKDAEVIHIY